MSEPNRPWTQVQLEGRMKTLMEAKNSKRYGGHIWEFRNIGDDAIYSLGIIEQRVRDLTEQNRVLREALREIRDNAEFTIEDTDDLQAQIHAFWTIARNALASIPADSSGKEEL